MAVFISLECFGMSFKIGFNEEAGLMQKESVSLLLMIDRQSVGYIRSVAWVDFKLSKIDDGFAFCLASCVATAAKECWITLQSSLHRAQLMKYGMVLIM